MCIRDSLHAVQTRKAFGFILRDADIAHGVRRKRGIVLSDGRDFAVPIDRAPVSYTHLDVYKRQVMENIDVPSGMGDNTITLTRDETENFLKIEDALSFDYDRYECTPEEVAERFTDSPIVRLCNAIIPATLGQEDLEEVFTWARFFNETGISAKLMNHPLTKLCEKLFDEHRLMDFHRCVLDVDYRKLLLHELAHN